MRGGIRVQRDTTRIQGVRATQASQEVERKRKRDSIDRDQDRRNMIGMIVTRGKRATIDTVGSGHMIVMRVIVSRSTSGSETTTTVKLVISNIRSTSSRSIP